jgi:transcriptional regulator with XRE-family HTH domain
MRSLKKTPVAVLRNMLELSIDEFGKLVGIAPSSVKSLENGRLALSEKTAFRIKDETGVSVAWLLNGNSKQKPYVERLPDGSSTLYTKERFERIQATKLEPNDESQEKLELRYDRAIAIITDWLSAYFHADEKGEADLAEYLMRKALEEIVDRFGKDDDGFMRVNAKAGIIQADGTPRAFIRSSRGIHLELILKSKKTAKAKS